MRRDVDSPDAARRRGRSAAGGDRRRSRPGCVFIALCALCVTVFCVSTYRLAEEWLAARHERKSFEALSAIVAENLPAATPAGRNAGIAGVGEAAPGDRERVALAQYVLLSEMNPDFFGWIRIEGTGIDYPVMHTPARPEYYLKRAFDGSPSSSGVPFVDGRCPADGSFYLIHGHHMRDRACSDAFRITRSAATGRSTR